MDIAELKQKSVAELHQLAEQLNISNYSGLRKQDLIFRIEQSLLEQDTVIRGEGVLEILPEGYGFLRSQDWNYLYGPDDIYVSPSQIKRFDLRTGDTVMGQVRPPKEGERYLALLKVESVNYEEPEKTKQRIAFDNLRPRYPDQKLRLEGKKGDLSLFVDRGNLKAHKLYRRLGFRETPYPDPTLLPNAHYMIADRILD